MAGAPIVAVVGSVNLDLVARCARLPRPGETLTDATFERVPGGKGANQALAAARLGAQGRADRGRRPRRVRRARRWRCCARGASSSIACSEVAEPTGVALILVGADGENQIVVAPGANAAVRTEDLGERGCRALPARGPDRGGLGGGTAGPLPLPERRARRARCRRSCSRRSTCSWSNRYELRGWSASSAA